MCVHEFRPGDVHCVICYGHRDDCDCRRCLRRRGDFVIVFRGGYAALKRRGEPDPPGHPDD